MVCVYFEKAGTLMDKCTYATEMAKKIASQQKENVPDDAPVVSTDTTVIEGTLEIQHRRGVVYFHPSDIDKFGATCLRICRLPTPIPDGRDVGWATAGHHTHGRVRLARGTHHSQEEHEFEPNGTTYPDNLYCRICGASETDHRL